MNKPTEKTITILHISDMQFGIHHEFGRRFQYEDGSMDTLKDRLCEDLRLMRETYAIAPDVVAVTGDLAEWGLPKEFAQAEDLLIAIAEETGLPRDRFLIVPGNHDINRKLCEAYFLTCEANGEEPVWPAYDKWKPFENFIARFYGHQNVFPAVPRWSLIEIPELKTAFACLNSTMAEGHLEEPAGDKSEIAQRKKERGGEYGHYGWCGEKQISWFAKNLISYERRQWLRVALIHHNLQPESRYVDKEYLRDAADFERMLGNRVNLVLHGHTHAADTRWLGGLQQTGHVPVMPTGSAGLKQDQRFNETPIQYQFIRIADNRIERFGREYRREAKIFVGDNLIGGGNNWQAALPLAPVLKLCDQGRLRTRRQNRRQRLRRQHRPNLGQYPWRSSRDLAGNAGRLGCISARWLVQIGRQPRRRLLVRNRPLPLRAGGIGQGHSVAPDPDG